MNIGANIVLGLPPMLNRREQESNHEKRNPKKMQKIDGNSKIEVHPLNQEPRLTIYFDEDRKDR